MANNNDKFISRENAKTLWGYMIDLLTGKQNKLTFDETPTQSSDNPVKSGGIFTALAGKGTYSKPQNGIPKTDLENAVQTSLGLADSALQSETDPTVPSWAKASDPPITSAQVAQIATNKTNVEHAINTGVKNLCNYVNPDKYIGCIIIDGEFKQTGTDSKTNLNFMIQGVLNNGTAYAIVPADVVTENGVYTKEFTYPSDVVKIRLGHNGSSADAKFEFDSSKFVSGTTYVLSINVLNCVQSSGAYRINQMMICTKQLWDTIGHDFEAYALPNSDLTNLEAEDRAGLAEVVDSGAKNLLDVSQATFGNKSKVTFNADGSVTGNITDDARIWGWDVREFTFTLPAGTYCMHVDVTGGSNNNWGVQLRDSSNNTYGYVSPYVGTTTYFTLTTSKTLGFIGKIFDRTLYIMLCTGAAFNVSQKFVPYRGSFGNKAVGTIDLNLLNTEGNYYVSSATKTNHHAPKDGYYFVDVYTTENGEKWQRAYRINEPQYVYQRMMTANTWGTWYVFAGTAVT